MYFLIFIGVLFYFLLLRLWKSLRYWDNKNVPNEKMTLIPFQGKFRKKSLYFRFPDKRYVGFYEFGNPKLLLRDPDLMKEIGVKEFETFSDRNLYGNENVDPLWARNLAAISGERWHDMRSTLSPTFTSSKLKMMFELMKDCTEHFTDYFLKQQGTVTVEMKDVFSRFANDVIGTTAFGVTYNSFENKDNEFYLMGQKLSNGFRGIVLLKFLLYNKIPSVMELLRVPIFPEPVTIFFSKIVQDMLKVRQEKGIIRPDMIQLLMEAKQGRLEYEESNTKEDSSFAIASEYKFKGSQNKRKTLITDEDITAHALTFFSGGFDTTSTLMTFSSYELALNPEIQKKLREEVDETLERYKGQLTYDGLMSMKYLDMVISETLRKWSPIPGTARMASKRFTISVEPERPEKAPVTIEKGTDVVFPIADLHKDPKYYPDPEKFDPERFSEENKHNIKPYTYLPFGIGPRNCIASRFALLEAKLIIAKVISKFEVIPVEKTDIPIQSYCTGITIETKNGAWLGLKPR